MGERGSVQDVPGDQGLGVGQFGGEAGYLSVLLTGVDCTWVCEVYWGRTDHKEDDEVGGVGWQSGFWESRIQEWEQSSWQVGHSPSGQLPFCF